MWCFQNISLRFAFDYIELYDLGLWTWSESICTYHIYTIYIPWGIVIKWMETYLVIYWATPHIITMRLEILRIIYFHQCSEVRDIKAHFSTLSGASLVTQSIYKNCNPLNWRHDMKRFVSHYVSYKYRTSYRSACSIRRSNKHCL